MGEGLRKSNGKRQKHKKRVEWRFLSGQRMFSNQDAPLSIQSLFLGHDIDPSPHSVPPCPAMPVFCNCHGTHLQMLGKTHVCVSEGDTEFPFRVDVVSVRTARMEARARG